MSARDRIARMLAELDAAPGKARSPAAWCEAAREIVGVAGAGVMLMPGEPSAGSLCTTDDVSARIEELQFTTGEGPCMDAYRQGRVVGEPDLARPRDSRWPVFAAAALQAGARAIFAFPVQLGAARLGVLDLYRDAAGPLRDEQHAAGLALAEVIARWVLDAQAGASPGTLAQVFDDVDFHVAVHNAAGAVSVQAGVGIAEALTLLRAYAFSTDRAIGDIAAEVVSRRIRFTADGVEELPPRG